MRHIHRRNPPLTLIASLFLLFCLGGCGHMAFGTKTPLDVSGPVSVDVVTFAGDVTVRSTGDAPGTPGVLVKPQSTHAFHRMGDAQASLEDIDWSVETVEENGRTIVRIRATTLYPESGLQRLHVTVNAPLIDGVRVDTSLGDVDLSEISGPIDVSTTRGDVDIVTGASLDDSVNVATTEGDIDLRAGAGTSGRLDAFTIDGRVICKVPTGKLRIHGRSSDRTMQGVINDGDRPITLRTNDGTIRIVVKKHPHRQSSFDID